MSKVQAALKRIAHAFSLTEGLLSVARGRYRKQHLRAVKLDRKGRVVGEKADHLRAEGRPKRAKRKDAKVARLGVREEKARSASRVRLGQVKRLNQKAKGLAHTQDELEAKLKALDHSKVKGDKVTGGTIGQRLQTAALASAAACAAGRRANFYSQLGAWDIDHCISGPARGHRDDCSSWFTSAYKSCGLADPNGQRYAGGFTGTLEAHGEQISREEATHTPGAAVLFGSPGATHHVEFALGDGTEHTIGHGSAPVDMGSFDLLSGPVRFFKYA